MKDNKESGHIDQNNNNTAPALLIPNSIWTHDIFCYFTAEKIFPARSVSKFFKENIDNAKRMKLLKSTILTPREDDVLKDKALSSCNQQLNEQEIKQYIADFITETNTAKILGYRDVEKIYQRIKSIWNLDQVITKPVMLMVAMHVLPSFEKYCASGKLVTCSQEEIQTKLLDMFTCCLIKDMAQFIRLEYNGVLHIGRYSIEEAILNYSVAVAKLMNTSKFLEIQEKEILNSCDSKLIRSKKFFCREFNSNFKDENEYRLLKYSREGCIFLHAQLEATQYRYKFIHEVFFDYFATLLPQSIQGSRKEIEQFLKDNPIGLDLMPQFKDPIKDPLSLSKTDGSILSY